MLKKRISKSAKFANLPSDRGRLLYLLLIPYVDCEGRLEANSHIIKGNVCPYIKTLSLQSITKCLKKMHEVGLIILYNISGEQYLQITRFEDFNKINKDREAVSHIPPPSSPDATHAELQINSGVAPCKGKVNKDNLNKEVVFPKNLDTPEFKAVWEEWKQYRIELKKKLIPTTIKKQLKMLSGHPAKAVSIIEESIKNGWQGLFPEKDGKNGKRTSPGDDFAAQISEHGEEVQV